MAYLWPNFKSKAAAKRALKEGKDIGVFQRNADITGAVIPDNGEVSIEGPHFPQAHSWYGTATLENGKVVKIK